jgi:nucleotide-binding universal stress UspA family protein
MTNDKLVILAGVQFDATADPVWDRAQALLATQPKAMLYLCHVLKPDVLAVEATDEKSPIDEALHKLHDWVEEKAGGKDDPICIQIHLDVAIGQPADELVQAAIDVEADLILVGTHGRGPVARLVIGSVAEAVTKRAPCSVLIARATDFTNTHKSPAIGPAPEAGHKPYYPHPAGRRSVDFVSFQPGAYATGAPR